MTASLLHLQVLSLLALVSCVRFYVSAFRIDHATMLGRFNVFAFATAALFLAAVL
jgi:hypothetical protein